MQQLTKLQQIDVELIPQYAKQRIALIEIVITDHSSEVIVPMPYEKSRAPFAKQTVDLCIK